MADKIYVQQGKMVVDSSLVPYIRKQDIEFEAENLRPGKISRIFFDEVVVNQLTQKANKIVVNPQKILGLTSASSVVIGTPSNFIAYQGPTLAANTFSGKIDQYYSANTTLVLSSLQGDFDISSPIYIQDLTNSTVVSANIATETLANTADIFYNGEGIYCQNNNVYMHVIASSGEDTLYVNENYVTINIGADVTLGATLATMNYAYQPGDIVFQTANGTNYPQFATYFGKVLFYTNQLGGNSVTVQTVSGVLNTNSSSTNSSSKLWNSSNSSSMPLQLFNTIQYDIGANNILVSTENTSRRLMVVSHQHNSGLISNISANTIEGGSQYVYLSSSNIGSSKDNLVYFTSGSGVGQLRRILSVSGKRLTLDKALDINPDHTTRYSLGNHIVDDYGVVAGIFNLPEDSNFKFKTGERIFTITDRDTINDADATMKASGKFTAGGLLNTTQRLTTTPVGQPLPEYSADNPVAPVNPTERTFNSVSNQVPVTGSATSDIPKMPLADGLSQTFYTPKSKDNTVTYGIFVTSVDLFFQSKPSVANGSLQLPVTLKIAQVVNGFPTKNYLAAKTLKAKNVKVSTSPSVSDDTTKTKFTFDDPVYLQPDSEYAIVVSSESPEYELYIAELGGDVLGATPPRRISEQPYAGSLFRSQNATTWTPYQNQDLMFVVNKAQFNTTGGSVTFNLSDSPLFQMGVDSAVLHSNELTFPSGQLFYRMKSYLKATGTADTYNYITPHQKFKYSNLIDRSNKVTSTNGMNSRLVKFGDANSVIISADFASTNPDVSPIFNKEAFSIALYENAINNAQLTDAVLTLTNQGAGYNATITAAQLTSANQVVKGFAANDPLSNNAQLYRQVYLANNFNIGLYAANITGGQGTGAYGMAIANTTGANTVDYIVILNGGSGYIETPTISIATPNAASAGVNAEAIALGETGKSGGNIRAKYLTRQIDLEEGFESGDLRVFMDANMPPGTDIVVYYKVLGSEDPDSFSNKTWQRMQRIKDVFSTGTKDLVELEYHPSLLVNKLSYLENGTQYPIGGKFKSFAIKVGLLATDPAVSPSLKNLRIISTPEG